jgi:hypothetical protein
MKTTCVWHHGEVCARYRPRPCRHGSRERRRTRNATGEHRKRGGDLWIVIDRNAALV